MGRRDLGLATWDWGKRSAQVSSKSRVAGPKSHPPHEKAPGPWWACPGAEAGARVDKEAVRGPRLGGLWTGFWSSR